MGSVRMAVATACLLAIGSGCPQTPAGDGSGGGAKAAFKTPRPIAARRPPPKETGCIADGLRALTVGEIETPSCEQEDTCAGDCDEGDAVACYAHAGALQEDPAKAAQATEAFRASCRLGLAIGCTNYGADLWQQGNDPRGWACAQRLFEKACDAGEPWGCGMFGRTVIDAEDAGPSDLKRGRAILERACDRLGSFSCRALALELEKGKLGAHKRGRIRRLLARACATGDRDGCGAPESAAATFR